MARRVEPLDLDRDIEEAMLEPSSSLMRDPEWRPLIERFNELKLRRFTFGGLSPEDKDRFEEELTSVVKKIEALSARNRRAAFFRKCRDVTVVVVAGILIECMVLFTDLARELAAGLVFLGCICLIIQIIQREAVLW